jgi:copper resistance protein B
LGISWNRKLSETADLAKLEGADVSVFGVVAGVRLWY